MKDKDLLRRTTGKLRLPTVAIARQNQHTTQTASLNRPTTTAAVPVMPQPAWQPAVQWKSGLVKKVSRLVTR